MTTFREGDYVIETGKGTADVHGQLILVGGSLSVVNAQGQLVLAFAPGAWRTVYPADDQ